MSCQMDCLEGLQYGNVSQHILVNYLLLATGWESYSVFFLYIQAIRDFVNRFFQFIALWFCSKTLNNRITILLKLENFKKILFKHITIVNSKTRVGNSIKIKHILLVSTTYYYKKYLRNERKLMTKYQVWEILYNNESFSIVLIGIESLFIIDWFIWNLTDSTHHFYCYQFKFSKFKHRKLNYLSL